jgi:uncharacterized coiled-coil protein SlyX
MEQRLELLQEQLTEQAHEIIMLKEVINQMQHMLVKVAVNQNKVTSRVNKWPFIQTL